MTNTDLPTFEMSGGSSEPYRITNYPIAWIQAVDTTGWPNPDKHRPAPHDTTSNLYRPCEFDSLLEPADCELRGNDKYWNVEDTLSSSMPT